MTTLINVASALTVTDVTRLTLLGLLFFACYCVACLFWWGDLCGKCEGKGGFPSPTGKYWRPCPRCKGHPRKLRLGARLLRFIGRALFQSRDKS